MLYYCPKCESLFNEKYVYVTYSGYEVWSRECPCGAYVLGPFNSEEELNFVTDEQIAAELEMLDPSLDGDEEVEFADTQYSDYPEFV